MGSNDITTIGEIAVVYDGPHATPEKIDVGPYFLSISSLENGKLDLSKSARLSEEQFIKWTRRVTPQEGDLLFSYETRLGDAALMPPNIKCCLGRRMGLLRPNQDKVLPAYLLYAYLSPDFQSVIDQRKVLGSTVDRISLTDLPNFPIRIPPLPEQKAIAHILGSLDDKIELNRRMNGTLEGMAQALFKSWFVDFDPVIDNALVAGNPLPDALAEGAGWAERVETRRQALATGSANRQAAQAFPAAFQLTEKMGWIPAGWEVGTIGNVAEKIGMGPFGSRITTDNFVASGVPVIRGGNLTNGFVDRNFVYLTEEKATELKSANVFSGDIIFTHRGTIGQVGIIPRGSISPRYVVSQSQMFLRINQEIMSSEYAFRYFKYGSGMERLLAFTSQVGVPAIARPTTSLKSLPILIPPMSIVSAFDSINSSYVCKTDANEKQSKTLTALRDTLLPKLISGELRIPDAEKLAEEALA